MLATKPTQYADLVKRVQGRCGNCAHRTHGAHARNGLPSLYCRVYEFAVEYDWRACRDEYRRAELAEDKRLERNARMAAYMRQHRAKGDESALAKLDADEPLPVAVPTECAHCGSTTLYRDPDGWGCPICGWHAWTHASERLYGERPVGDALPALFGILRRGW